MKIIKNLLFCKGWSLETIKMFSGMSKNPRMQSMGFVGARSTLNLFDYFGPQGPAAFQAEGLRARPKGPTASGPRGLSGRGPKGLA